VDNVFMPTQGYYSRQAVEVSTMDVDMLGLSVEGKKYWTVAEPAGWGKHVFSLRGKAAVVDAYSGRVPFFERLYAGGVDTLRGFTYRGVAPSDPTTGDRIGGESMLVFGAEYSVPIHERMLRGAAFVDAGYVEEKARDVFSGWDVLRMSTGVGIRWLIPALGNAQLSLDLAFPLKREDDDDTRSVHFSLGAARTF
jgi:outer membrane protein insertion porin family